jgi:hypothetical protein
MGALCYQRSGRPDLDVYRSRFEPLSAQLGPRAVDDSFVTYRGIEGGFQGTLVIG